MTDLNELLDRVRGATGPDRELDCQLAYATDYAVEGTSFRSYCDVHDLKWGEIARHANSPQSILNYNLPRFTASIDAALALVERVFPGWGVQFGTMKTGGARARVALDWPEFAALDECHDAPTKPLAILAALLQALTSQEQK